MKNLTRVFKLKAAVGLMQSKKTVRCMELGKQIVQVICSGGNARLDLAAEGFRLEHP